MARGRKSGNNADLFIEGSGQLRLVEKSTEQEVLEKSKVECLGMTFESEDGRRLYFTQKLRERLADPEFRKIPGFPKGSNEDIIRMSDAPWYTACPNPFLADFVKVYGKPYDPKELYERDPFAVDTSVGKTDALYKAHAYHTKVPHLAIVPSILHYTQPGDIVLDGFSGSGMTGVAAQWCGAAPSSFKHELDAEWLARGHEKPTWGIRRAILNDLGPAPTFISANYVRGIDPVVFSANAEALLENLHQQIGWMYETSHGKSKKKGLIKYTVWSEVFSCPECSGEVVFIEHALDPKTKAISNRITCPHCTAVLLKEHMDLHLETVLDVTGSMHSRPKRRPFMIVYDFNGDNFEKKPDAEDLAVLKRIDDLGFPSQFPVVELANSKMTREGRMAATGTKYLHHMYMPRAIQALAALWRLASDHEDWTVRSQMLFFVEQAIWTMSVLNRYRPDGFSQVNQFLSGVFYVPSQSSEPSPWYVLTGKAKRLAKAFSGVKSRRRNSIIQTASCEAIGVPDNSIDYIFTDPPFGGNIYYADLNIMIEAWHGVTTVADTEAIVDKTREKTVLSYQNIMRQCFGEYRRVLKPGRWMTVVFSNSSNAVWRAIQESLGASGFVIADVRTLDKKQGSFMQVTTSAVKQDLVISAYKPSAQLTKRFELGESTEENAWAFVTEHLSHVPVFSNIDGVADVIGERTAQILHDRMVAFHVQRHLSVPLATAEFVIGLMNKYPERDGMFFLPAQVGEYDRKRNNAAEMRQLSLFVTDEATAIQWVRRELQQKPRSFQDLQPLFMREIQSWAKHEETIELREILRQNCIHYEGVDPVPTQIHSYLSSNFKELRNLPKDDSVLISKAVDRWYVPDPSKQIDLEKLREKSLLGEFEEYKTSKERKLKLFRSEAVRAGFKAAYDNQDYKTIVAVAVKLPENVLQEDEKLLMYFDVASMRLGSE